MSMYCDAEDIEAGVDEVARGCLAGPVFAAAVIWPKELEPEDCIKLRDSKKLSKKKREEMRDYIEATALDYSVAYINAEEIDEINILNASIKAMHEALDGLNIKPEALLIDGNKFKPYQIDGEIIPFQCFVKGDDLYQSISAASILAKVYHDDYITNLVDTDSKLEVYDWKSNMCYGTKKHLDAISQHGISPHHRKSFGICKEYC